MKAVLLAVGVVGLAAVFGLSEPAPASAKPITSDDVWLVSEQVPDQAPRHASAQRCAHRFRCFGGGGH